MNLSTDVKTFVVYFLLVMTAIFTIVVFFLHQAILNVQDTVVKLSETVMTNQNITMTNQQLILENKELQQNNTSKLLAEH